MSESPLRFVKVDYQSIKDSLIDRIRSRWPNLWNDYLDGSFGTIIVDLIAWVISNLAYTVNRLAGENFIDTMTLRESAVKIGRLVGYKLKGALPSTILAEASIPESASSPITIYAGTLVRSSDSSNLPFETEVDYTIYAGATTPDTTILEISPSLSGNSVFRTGISVTQGSPFLDLLDPSADLSGVVSRGMTFLATGSTIRYKVRSVTSSPGAVSNNRLVLEDVWTEASSIVTGRVFDTRIALTQGQTIVDRYVSPTIDTPNFKVLLSRTLVISGSVKVDVNGDIWTEVDRLTSATSAATNFEVRVENGYTYLTFGDGIVGSLMPVESSVTVTYRVGGGSVGNLPPGSVDSTIIGKIVSTNTPVAVRVYNSTPGEGGQDQETLEEARVNIPNFARTQDRAVTGQDYVATALNFSSPSEGRVKFARTAIRVQNSLLEGNVVVVYCWSQGVGGTLVPLTPTLKSSLKEYLQTKAVGTDYVVISDGTSRPLPLVVRFRCRVGFDPVSVTPFVNATITDIVAKTPPGEPIIFSDLVTAISATLGVETAQIPTPAGDVSPITTDEVFTIPDENFRYSVTLASQPTVGNNYEGIIPVAPLSAWGIRCFVNDRETTVVHDLEPNYALLISPDLNEVRFGPLSSRPDASQVSGSYFLATDQGSGALFKSVSGLWLQKTVTEATRSRVNLRTGQVILSGKVPISQFDLALIAVSGYQKERKINLYLGYSGDLSANKRNEIRAALRDYFDGLTPGATLFANPLSNNYDASSSNLTDVVKAVAGVTSVNRISLETPTNSSVRVDSTSFELLRAGVIVINNDVN